MRQFKIDGLRRLYLGSSIENDAELFQMVSRPHIKIFLVDGVPDGTLTAEIMNWTGHVLFAPRARIVDVLQRPEIQRTGVYLLVGENPKDEKETLVYVGQGDDVSKRLAAHNKDPDKEFWESVCVITNKDLNLTAAHGRFLESKLISIIRKEGRARLTNKTEPMFDRLPEGDLSDMEDFVARLQMLLPVLGVQFIRPTPNVSVTSKEASGRNEKVKDRLAIEGTTSPTFKFSSANIKAHAVEVGGQMVVLMGSEAQATDQPSLPFSARTYREQLRKAGKLSQGPRPNILEFTDDVAFSSPSAAAEGVMGTSRNGRIDWIVEGTSRTYADWQESEVEKVEDQTMNARAAEEN